MCLLPESVSPARYSRYIKEISLSPRETWREYLLGPHSRSLHGAVLLACCDAGIEIINQDREELSSRFRLDASNPEAQETLLNKLSTYKAAARAGVPTPLFWEANGPEQVLDHKEEYVYPLLVKPLYSHKFSTKFNRKFLLVDDFAQMMKACRDVWKHGLGVVLLEMIPGPDDRLCSYYTYFDESGVPLFDFTKRIVRRYPENEGLGCYHITDRNPQVRDLALRLFTSVGLLGLANAEFKLDERDGTLKIIECNCRFTAANQLVAASGYDLGLFVYGRLAGVPYPTLMDRRYKEGMRLWYPGRDFLAFLELRSKGKLSLLSWLASILHPMVLPYFSWSDPLPSISLLLALPWRALAYWNRRVARSHGDPGME